MSSLTIGEAARDLRIPAEILRRWVRTGIVRGIHRPGAGHLISDSEMAKLRHLHQSKP